MAAAFLILVFLPATVSADGYLGGIPLTTVQSGTVSGDLWFDAAPAPDWGSRTVTRTFLLPAAAVARPDRIRWARLYVSVYCGHMQNNYRGMVTTSWDGNGDSLYEQHWSESLDTPYNYPFDGGSGPVLLNDHLNRVTSDYFMWYNVTGSISAQNVTARVATTPVDGSFDGRIKVITLVVAYDDGDEDVIHYRINQGHDTCSYYYEDNFGEVAVGTTSFDTTDSGPVTNATLTATYMASSNGFYGFPSGAYNQTGRFFDDPLTHGYTEQAAYSGYQTWNVTALIPGDGDTTLAFTRDLFGTGLGGFFKIPLAFLKYQQQPVTSAPAAAFIATPLSGPVPLTVQFTDRSVPTASSWTWEYRFRPDGGTSFGPFTRFSTLKNPRYTFDEAGYYLIRLTAANAAGNTSRTEGTTSVPYLHAVMPAPVAMFTATPGSGIRPLTVIFNDTSTGVIHTYAWDFTSNGTTGSTDKNTSYTFTTSGIYTVNLTVSGPGGSSSAARTVTVSDTGIVPSANFTADVRRGNVPHRVKFNDRSEGTVTSWAWDFNNDGRNDSAEQNPTYIYPEKGVYSVSLTVSGPFGADTWTRNDYITVRGSPDCDLTIAGAVNPVASTVFAKEPNTVRIVNLQNNGPKASPATTVLLRASDGFTTNGQVPPLESGQNITIALIDGTVRPSAGATVIYNVTVDPEDNVAETDENNNSRLSSPKTVTYNGYKGKRYWNGGDITTRYVFDIHGGLVHSFGDSVYQSGSFGGGGWTEYTVTWRPGDLLLPTNASVRQALLYVPYTWDNTQEIEQLSLRFNGNAKTRSNWYHDASNFGAYADHLYGLVTYDVTTSFARNAQNTAAFSRASRDAKLSMYGCTLAVIYEDNETPRTQIFINEGFDLLGADENGYGTTPEEATAYIPFTRMTIDPAAVSRAELITFVASGDNEGTLLLNNESLQSGVWDFGSTSGPHVAVASHDITGSLKKTGNFAAIQSTAGETPAMGAMQQFLIVEYGNRTMNHTRAALVADFSAEPLNGTAPLTVNFTDLSTGKPVGWAWDFENDGIIDNTTQFPQHTYLSPGNFTVNLTVKNLTASHMVNRTGYIHVANTTVVPATTVLPKETIMPRTTASVFRAPDTGTIVPSETLKNSPGSGDILGAVFGAVQGLVDLIYGGLRFLLDRLPVGTGWFPRA